MKAFAVLAASLMIAVSLSMSVSPMAHPPRAVVPADDPEIHPIGFFRGTLPTPSSGEALDKTYHDASSYTQFVPVRGDSGDFWDLASDLNGTYGNDTVGSLIRGNGMFPLVQMTFFNDDLSLAIPPELLSATLSDPIWRGEYRKAALDVVNASRPAYLSLGTEVNLWYEEHGAGASDPDGFQHWVSLYEAIYDEVKALSPRTTVFCTFSREVVDEAREADMSVLSMFGGSKLDMLMLTSYPHTVPGINEVVDVPNDYLSSVYDHIGLIPFGLSAIAWPSFSAFGGESGQAQFVRDAVGRLTRDRGLDLKMVCWDHLTDMDSGDRTGLRYLNGTAKLSLGAWKMNSAPYYLKENRTIDLLEDFSEYSYNLTRTFKDPDLWDRLTFYVRNETGVYTDRRNFSLVDVEISGPMMRLTSHPDQIGYVQVMVKAIDHDGLSAWALMQVNVAGVNDAPRMAVPFGTIDFLEDHSLDVQVSYHIMDPDDEFDKMTMKIGSSPDLAAEVHGAYLRVYSKEDNWNGMTHVVLKVSDPSGSSLSSNISFRVLPENDAPTLTLPSLVKIPEDGSIHFDLNDICEDAEGDPVEWNITVVSGEIRTILDGANLTLRPAPDWFGLGSVLFKVDDGTDSTTLWLNVTVPDINDPPMIQNFSSIDMIEDVTLYYNLSALNATDVEGTALSWHIIGYSDLFRSVSILDNGTMRLDPGLDDHGYAYVNTTVMDSSEGITAVYFPVTIGSVNDPPFLLMRTNTTFKVNAGSFVLIDLEDSPFILYDVERANSELTAVTDCSSCVVKGMILNVSIPEGTVLDHLIVSIRVRDPEGAYSNETRLTIEIVRPEKEYRLSIDTIQTEIIEGRSMITARGGPYQVVWVVFEDGTSMKMTETPPGNGKYILDLGIGPWADGTVLRFHLSAVDDGPNDTPWAPTEFTYRKNVAEPDKDLTWTYILGATLLIALLMALTLLFFIRRAIRQRSYSDLVEE
jgi:hypothetical protein